MAEAEVRKTLAKVDALRADADLCERMATDWMGHNGELVIEETVVLKRRWRWNTPRTVHSERIVGPAERDMLRDWLLVRAQQRRAEASALIATLGRGVEGTGSGEARP